MSNIIQSPTKAMNTTPPLIFDDQNPEAFDEWLLTDKGKKYRKDSEYFYKCFNEYLEQNKISLKECFILPESTPKAGE